MADEAEHLVTTLLRSYGGRYSSALGIDVDAGAGEVERWFVASTLFGSRISARIAERAFEQLSRVGIRRIVDAGLHDWGELVALLDAGGYARYDFRTATRLQTLARVVSDRYGGDIAEIGRRFTDPVPLLAALNTLPGWGPVTAGLFLRELRGEWPGARLPLDPLAARAGRHLELLTGHDLDELAVIMRLAQRVGCDERDLEAGLVRMALAHLPMEACAGGSHCVALAGVASATPAGRLDGVPRPRPRPWHKGDHGP